MRVSFQSIPSMPSSICGICLEPLENDAVAHDAVGALHPLHRACVREWAKRRMQCPYCFQPIDASSLFSWKERTVIVLQKGIHNPILREGTLFMIAAGIYFLASPDEPSYVLMTVVSLVLNATNFYFNHLN